MAIDTTGIQGSGRGDAFDDEQINLRRYIAAIGRSRVLIVAIVVLFTGLVLFLSLALPKSYKATSQISLNSSGGVLAPADAQSQQRQLATIESLLSSEEVLGKAASTLPGVDLGVLRPKIESTVDSAANIIYVSATDGDPDSAAAYANATARALLSVRQEAESAQYAAAKENLQREVSSLRTTGSIEDQAQLEALRREIGTLSLQEELAGSELQLASAAEVPTAPNSPRPFRNVILAFFVSLFIGVLIALVRDQLRPKVAGPRELSRLSNMPLLGGVPYVRGLPTLRGWLGKRAQALSAAEFEAYQALRTSFTVALPPDRQHVVLVASAVHGEGKTTASARLGRALAHEGHKTLLIGADLRFPPCRVSSASPSGSGWPTSSSSRTATTVI